jgi:hypothetical protein
MLPALHVEAAAAESPILLLEAPAARDEPRPKSA